ncbi:MAG TPA: hypothetical protein VKD69_10870 [Vicinamibacterales bacterium]|nr:hypothetical protein [Vicinamibacterales bacterium]
MIRKAAIVFALVWALVVTCLRSARLPNNFATEHWLIDYRFGFVKRGLIGSVVAVATALGGTRPSEALIDALSIVLFIVFCGAILWAGLRIVRRSGWSPGATAVVLAFLSSPFVVMSAHLIGYYDDIVVILTLTSLWLLFKRRPWAAAAVLSISVLVHENALLIGLPVFAWACWHVADDARPEAATGSRWRRLLPAILPLAVFALLTVRLSTAPHRLERDLTAYLSTYPFVAGTIADVRVPHWITITFNDSYLLHRGHVQERLLSQPMIALVLPTLLALLGALFEARATAAVSIESAIALVICLVPESMHVMAWDTSRIWTYPIVSAFLLVWVDAELRPSKSATSQLVVLISLVALVLNAIGVTPLMDGLRDRFDVTTRLLLYAPVMAIAAVVAGRSTAAGRSAKPSGERVTFG